MTAWQERLARRIESIDEAAADNRLRTESYRQLTEELKAVDGRASSPDGLVTVVTGPGGVLKSIVFSDAVRNVAPATLSAAVMHTVAKAQADVTRSQADVVRRGLGDTELLDRVLSEEQRLFGDQRPQDPGPAPGQQNPARQNQVRQPSAWQTPDRQTSVQSRPAQAPPARRVGAHRRADDDFDEGGFEVLQRPRR